MTAVSSAQRFTPRNRCPICGGCERDPRGQGKRCTGYASTDGKWVFCSREEHGGTPTDAGLFRHLMKDEPMRSKMKREIVYDYRDAAGTLLYQVVRYVKADGDKGFAQRQPNGGKGRGDAPRVLYRLPELVAADPDAPVYIVEGEKDVETLRKLGHVATCNPEGVGKWKFVRDQAREVLRGRNVVVVADRDQVGEKHARDVAASLEGVAASVIVLVPQAPHKDVTDVIEAGGTLDELQALSAVQPEPAAAVEGDGPKLVMRNGRPVPHVANVALVLASDSRCAGLLEYDDFRGDIALRGALPCPPELVPAVAPTELSKEVCTRFAAWLLCEYDLDVRAPQVAEAAATVAAKHPRHEVRDWLSSLRWDGVARVDDLFVRYFGAADTPYHRGIASCFLLSAVARVFEPGCQHDYLPVLEGPQGSRKSSGLRALFGPDYYSDTAIDLSTKDAFEVLRGLWCQCLDEIDSYEKQHVARIKNYVSSRKDRYRPSYGEKARDFPRQIVFAATTNASVYFRDQTGNRRFWPVSTTRVDVAAIERDRAQLWAEAVVRYRAGERRYPTADLEVDARDAQEERRIVDPWSEFVRQWTLTPRGNGVRPIDRPFSTADVLQHALQKEAADLTRADEMRVGDVLRELGFVRERRRAGDGGARVYVWVRPVPTSVEGRDKVGTAADGENGSETPLSLPSLPRSMDLPYVRAHARAHTTPPKNDFGGGDGRDSDADERAAIEGWS